jgi:hypothetical protein
MRNARSKDAQDKKICTHFRLEGLVRRDLSRLTFEEKTTAL